MAGCMNTLLLAAAIPAAILLAPLAHADKQKDDIFLLTIDTYGIAISHHEALIEAQAVCVTMETGTSMTSTGLQLVRAHPSWTVNDAGHFIGAATQSYCPTQAPG